MSLSALGWEVWSPAPDTLRWVEAAADLADRVLSDPAERRRWLRHGGTWFVGVDALPTGPDGAAGEVRLPATVRARLPGPLHPAQLSVVYPGYPRRDPEESEAAHRFRRDRDAAHLDGLLPVGPDRRRFALEPHAIICGLPLDPMDPAPLVVWEGSHRVLRERLRAAVGKKPLDRVDLTDAYAAARREVFETCPRREISAPPGGVIWMHRLALHGMAPWRGPAEGQRRVAYFRPQLVDPGRWLAEEPLDDRA